MTYLRIESASIEASNLKSLMHAWKLYGGPLSVVGSFRVTKPLTRAQRRRLPAGLRDRLA
jgi:hypothetical protein